MITFYVDESGDLGKSEKSSKYIVIALLSIPNTRTISLCIRKALRAINKTRRERSKLNELHFNKLIDIERVRVLKKIVKKDLIAHIAILEKRTIKSNFFNNRVDSLYEYLCRFIAKKAIYQSRQKVIKLYIDKSFAKKKRERINKIITLKTKKAFGKELKIEIEHLDSQQEPCIQAADIIAGATFCKYEWEEEKYYKLIKDKIKTEDPFFKAQKKERSHATRSLPQAAS